MRWLFVLSAASLLLFLSVMRVACMPMDNSAHHHNKHHESHVQSADAGSTLETNDNQNKGDIPPPSSGDSLETLIDGQSSPKPYLRSSFSGFFRPRSDSNASRGKSPHRSTSDSRSNSRSRGNSPYRGVNTEETQRVTEMKKEIRRKENLEDDLRYRSRERTNQDRDLNGF